MSDAHRISYLQATGRVVGFELIPLSELKRPRIDVLASLSGIFRDSFSNVLGELSLQSSLECLGERGVQSSSPSQIEILSHRFSQKFFITIGVLVISIDIIVIVIAVIVTLFLLSPYCACYRHILLSPYSVIAVKILHGAWSDL